jgi:hypothetical protein
MSLDIVDYPGVEFHFNFTWKNLEITINKKIKEQ